MFRQPASRQSIIIAVIVSAALTAYVTPWVHSPSTALTLTAYDLAEWTTLHPVSRSAALPYFAALLLRWHLAALCALIALFAPPPPFKGLWWAHALAVLVLIVAQLPPPEFVTQLNDGNYQQQAALGVLSLLFGGLGLSGRLHRWRYALGAGLGVAGVITALGGLGRAVGLMQQPFNLPVSSGAGGWVLALIYSVFAAYCLWQLRQQRRQNATR